LTFSVQINLVITINSVHLFKITKKYITVIVAMHFGFLNKTKCWAGLNPSGIDWTVVVLWWEFNVSDWRLQEKENYI